MRPLRICRVCGLEAYTEEDLEPFVKHRNKLHGHDTICKKCHCEIEKERWWNKRGKFIEVFRERSPDGLIRCYFCGEITEVEIIHSLDGDHENWSPENKVPAHWGCHSSHHNTNERHPAWKGDEASDDAKYMRGRRVLAPYLC